MGIEEYLVDKKALENVQFLAEGYWESAPEIGIIGGTKVEPKTLTDAQIRWLTLDTLGYVKGGQTDYNTGTGFFLGYSSTAYKFSIGDASANYVTFDGTTLSVGGAITATSGTIGSFTIGTYLYTGSKTAWNDANAGVHIGSDGIGIGNNVFTVNGSTGALVATSATITGAITATSGTIGSFTIGTYLYTGTKTAWNDTNAGVHVGSDGIGIGNNVFTVNGSTGALVATSATITGTITATAGAIGGWTIAATSLTGGSTILESTTEGGQIKAGATDLYVGTGFYYSNNNGTPEFRVGTVAASALTAGLAWDGTNLSWIGVNTSLTAAGLFTASNAVITGAITASSGSITGPLTMSGASASIAIGTTPPTSATVGTGIWLDRTGLYGLNADVQQAYLQASDGKIYFGGGAGTLSNSGLSLVAGSGTSYQITWVRSGTATQVAAVTGYFLASNLVAGSCEAVSPTNAEDARWIITTQSRANAQTSIEVFQDSALAADCYIRFKVDDDDMAQVDLNGLASYGRITSNGYIYPGTGAASQTTRYIYDNGSNLVVDSVVVATHTHTGAGGGGTVAMSSVSGTISTTQHGALGAITNAHAWADINKATSSIADITTKSAGALDSGNLAIARMPVSGNWAITDVAYVSGANFGFGATPSARVHVTDATAGDNTIALFTGGAARSAGFRNFACGSDADRVGLFLPTGTGDYRIWIGDDGNLRIMTGGDPTSANDGTIVGTQS